MLFEEEGQGSPREMFDQLKKKAREAARVLREKREEVQALKERQAQLQQELDTLKARLAFYESERGELRGTVEELLKEFDQVTR